MKIYKSLSLICLIVSLFLIVPGTADKIYATSGLYGSDVFTDAFYTIDTGDGTQNLIDTITEDC